MKKKEYESPKMEVVVMPFCGRLLENSIIPVGEESCDVGESCNDDDY